MTMLAELPAGRDLMSSLYEAARNLALAYAGTPDDRAEASLRDYVAAVLPELTEAMGRSMAVLTLHHFKLAVMSQKHRLESTGISRV